MGRFGPAGYPARRPYIWGAFVFAAPQHTRKSARAKYDIINPMMRKFLFTLTALALLLAACTPTTPAPTPTAALMSKVPKAGD